VTAFLDSIEPWRRRPWAGYAFGLAAFLLALGLRRILGEAMPGSPFLGFLPAITLTALIGGVVPGLIVASLSGFAAWYFLMPPMGAFGLAWPQGWSSMGLFAAVAALDIWLVHLLTRSVDRLRAERKRSDDLLALHQTMFQELQHRVANNMQFVSSVLSLQKRQLRHSPEAVAALDTAAGRLHVMARIHRRLYQPERAASEFGKVIEEICHDLLQATGARNVVCRVEVPPLQWGLDRLISLSLIVTELLTNALKHGFPDGRAGTISVALERLDPTRVALIVRDDGRGIPADFQPATTPSLGMQIVHSLAARLGAELSFSNGSGTTARLIFAG
jgi:two-component sensor histidine kinase